MLDLETFEPVDRTLWSATLRPLTDPAGEPVAQDILSSKNTAAVHREQVGEGQQLAIRVELGPDPSRVRGAMLLEADGGAEVLSPCTDEGELVKDTNRLLSRSATARDQSPAELVDDLVRDAHLAAQLWDADPDTTSATEDTTPTTSPPPPPPPGSRIVRVTVAVPDPWLTDGDAPRRHSLCARTVRGIGTCAKLSRSVGPAPDLFITAGPEESIEVVVVEGMNSDAVVGIAGTIDPNDVPGDVVSITLAGEPDAPTLTVDP